MVIGKFNAYKGFEGTIEIDKSKAHGKLLGMKDKVTYEAYELDSLCELYDEFKAAVDDYIEYRDECKG